MKPTTLASASLAGLTLAFNAAAQTPTYITTYETFQQYLNWRTCEYGGPATPCFGGGTLGPFGRMCSVVGSGNRFIVADASPTGSAATKLYIYTEVESPTPSVTLKKTVSLPLTPASATSQCHMAILGSFLYFGTSESYTFYKINLKTGEVLSDVIPTRSVSGVNAITANADLAIVSGWGVYKSFDKLGREAQVGPSNTDYFGPGVTGYAPR